MTLKRNLKVPIVILLLITLLVPAYISLVSSSSGYIRINGTSASVPYQQVPVGGNVNLYFGEVTWQGSEFYLLLSHDLSSRVSTGDSIYTPLFSVYDVTNTTAPSIYTSGDSVWVAGNNWINGSIPSGIPVGNYSIKAFDAVNSSDVAVTDTFFTVYTVVYNGTLQISPSSGPGGVTVQFTGSDYPPNSTVTISYYDPTFGTWSPWESTTANETGYIMFDSVIPDLKLSLGAGDYPETYATVSYRTESNSTIYSYADYNQYSRGLKRVGNQIANGLYGNGTNLASTVKVEVNDTITLSGKWFHPGDAIYVRLDSKQVMGTVTGDQWLDAEIIGQSIASPTGYFETNITIPLASAGEHYLSVEDSETRVIVKILVSQGSLQVSPSSGPGGVSVEFTGSGYPNGSDVTISYYDPTFDTWNPCGSTTADSLGSITFTTEMPDLRKSLSNYDSYEQYTPISFRTEINGTVYNYVDYYQYWRGLKRVGDLVANGLFGNGTNLCSGNETVAVRVDAGDKISISGRWFHSNDVIYVRWDGTAVVGTVTSDEWRDAEIIGTPIASSTGSFEASVTIPTADVGEHYVSVEDSETRVIVKIYLESSPAPTPEPTPTPTPTPSPPPQQPGPTVTVSCRSTTRYTGFDVEIYGTLSFNGVAASEESVFISYSVTGGRSWEDLTHAKTGSDGAFLVLWKPPVTGNYLIKAKWEGNSTFNEASTIVNLALTPYLEESWFSVTSNSTITAFAFNSTSKELSFTASGPSDTTGHVSVCIPKTLISDISDLKVYLDENLITYNSESQEDSWIVSFSYSHSEHKVVIDLSAASSKDDETPTDFTIYIIIIAIVIAAAVATITLKRKRQHTPTQQQ